MRHALPLLLLAASAATAQTVKVETTTVQTSEHVSAGTSPVIRGDGLKRTVTCNRGRVTIQDNGNEIVMRGPCERVAIQGSNHRVAIEEVGSLTVNGTGHRVQWVRGLDGRQPKITSSGTGTTVEPITAATFAALPVPTSHD
jgi:hypothetical protein